MEAETTALTGSAPTAAVSSCCGGAGRVAVEDPARPVALTLEDRTGDATETAGAEAGDAVMTDDATAAQDAAGCCATDNPWGYADHKQDYVRRLRRIEGQVRGLQRMVDEDQYCIDILTQISAVTKALESTALRLLDEHLSHCVMHAIEAGGEEADQKLAEASAAIARLVRS